MQPHDTTQDIPYGYCHCGCGQKTKIARQSHTKMGWIKGEPLRFLTGHSGGRRKFASISEQFWTYCPKDALDECWEWTSTKDTNGYGVMRHLNKTQAAHRVSYQIANGAIPHGQKVCHKCDNPSCCNPNHLFLGTQADNMHDMVNKERHARGDRNGHAKLTESDIVQIKRLSAEGMTGKAIAAKYGVTKGCISNILNGIRWAHIT